MPRRKTGRPFIVNCVPLRGELPHARSAPCARCSPSFTVNSVRFGENSSHNFAAAHIHFDLGLAALSHSKLPDHAFHSDIAACRCRPCRWRCRCALSPARSSFPRPDRPARRRATPAAWRRVRCGRRCRSCCPRCRRTSAETNLPRLILRCCPHRSSAGVCRA